MASSRASAASTGPILAEHRRLPTALLWGRPSRRPDVASVDPARALVGRLLDERFEPTRILGRGGMGVVYEALDRALERPVVVKVVAPDSSDPSAADRLVREAKLACRVQHPCIVTVLHLGVIDGTSPFVVMEKLEGHDLATHVDAPNRSALSLARTAALIEPVAEALAALHEAGIVHRDVKPENVFVLAGRAHAPRVKLIDFGLAMLDATSAARLTATGRLLGTAEYIAPECVRGATPTAAADVYSLATMTYELLTGELPFDATGVALLVAKTCVAPTRLAETLHASWVPAVDALLDRALDRDPGARPSALDFADELRSIADTSLAVWR